MPDLESFAAELFLGRLRLDLLAMPPGDPRRLDPRDEEFLARLRGFCADRVDSARIEREDRVPDEVIEGLRELGAFCVKIPREYGGLGLSEICYLRALMIVSSVHSALAELLAAHQAIGLPQPLLVAGTERQKREFLPRCAREISAFALTEVELGNDPFRVRTTAVRHADTYVLNGVKLWTTNGVIADLLVVVADVPGKGSTAFVVETARPGVSVEHRGAFLGLRGVENGVIRLRDVEVPAGNRIGAEGAGLDVALAAQDTGRLSLPAACAATAKWSLGIARRWAAVREQWGRPIGRHDAVAGKLAFIAATAFALEAMVEVTGRQPADTSLDAELAKLLATELAWRVADELMQVRGGRGYETAASAVARGERGVPVEQALRDTRIGRIFDGSSEVLRVFLARSVLARHACVERPPVSVAGPLADQLRFVDKAARRLAGEIAAAANVPEEHQRHLGRLVDIGAELYAMSVTCVYAAALPEDTAAELANAFCEQARRRVADLFERLADNHDAGDREVAARVLDDRYLWLEDGVLDPSTDGPWIAEPVAGPDVRRTIGRSPR